MRQILNIAFETGATIAQDQVIPIDDSRDVPTGPIITGHMEAELALSFLAGAWNVHGWGKITSPGAHDAVAESVLQHQEAKEAHQKLIAPYRAAEDAQREAYALNTRLRCKVLPLLKVEIPELPEWPTPPAEGFPGMSPMQFAFMMQGFGEATQEGYTTIDTDNGTQVIIPNIDMIVAVATSKVQ